MQASPRCPTITINLQASTLDLHNIATYVLRNKLARDDQLIKLMLYKGSFLHTLYYRASTKSINH